MPSDRAIAGSLLVIGAPETASRPESGFTAPVMILIRVLLPAPFSPTRAWTSPARSSNDTPFSACTPANAFRMDLASRRGVVRVMLAGSPTVRTPEVAAEFALNWENRMSRCSPRQLRRRGFAQQIAPDEYVLKICNHRSPITNLEDPSAISVINNFAAQPIAKDR